MKTNAFDSKTWDDLVFENKNKEYGAYLVRKSYTQNMTTGFGISVSLACLLLILPQIVSMLTGKPPIVPPIFKGLPDLPVIELGTMPPIQPPPARQTPPPVQRTSANLTPHVTTENVDTDIPTNDDISDAMPSTDTHEGGVPDGTGDVPVAAPVIEEPGEFLIAEVMPKYEGGMEGMMRFLSRKIHYPATDRRIGTEGTVFVSFVVDKDGRVRDVRVIKGISATCDQEAVRVVSLLNAWTPGMQNHRAVSVRMTLPIKFTLEK